MKTGYHGIIFCFWTRLSILISAVWCWISKAQVPSICTGKQPSTWGDHSSVHHQKLIPTLLILFQNFWSHPAPHQLNLHFYTHITFSHFLWGVTLVSQRKLLQKHPLQWDEKMKSEQVMFLSMIQLLLGTEAVYRKLKHARMRMV